MNFRDELSRIQENLWWSVTMELPLAEKAFRLQLEGIERKTEGLNASLAQVNCTFKMAKEGS
jgi:hypothetical protein